jgi:hypothetical protein
VSQDFQLQVFSINQFPPPPQAPEYPRKAVSNFLKKIAGIFGAQGAPLMSLTPVAKWKKSSIRKVLIF